MVKKSKSLADKISSLLTTAPIQPDPEDGQDETSAKVLSDNEIENEEEDLLLSKFRNENIDLLADLDDKYVGKKSSRKEFLGSEESDSESETAGSHEPLDDDSSEESEQSDSGEEEQENDSDVNLSENETKFQHFQSNDNDQVKKGTCVRNQMQMWESLLEMRIQLQKCLITSNKLPEPSYYKKLKKDSSEFVNKASETQKSLSNVLEKLLCLQNLVLKKFPETKNLEKVQKASEESDEEIPSDTEEEKSSEESEIEEEPVRKKRKITEYETELKDRFEKYQTYRNNVIQKWNDKTRLAVTKQNTVSHSVLNQIEHSLRDRERLIKRTQLKRSDYKILGQEEEPEEEQNEDNGERKRLEEYNKEIFDDDDFYHQLLRELIEVKSADVTDPVQLGRQWIQLQNLRSKMKRKIDTKATKGRKIRYGVHNKLVNFMAPMDENLMTDEAKNELFNSLFGKRQITC